MTQEKFNEMLKNATSVSGTGDKPSSWAKEACEWAKQNKIFNGDGKGNYGWQTPITREALAVTLYT